MSENINEHSNQLPAPIKGEIVIPEEEAAYAVWREVHRFTHLVGVESEFDIPIADICAGISLGCAGLELPVIIAYYSRILFQLGYTPDTSEFATNSSLANLAIALPAFSLLFGILYYYTSRRQYID